MDFKKIIASLIVCDEIDKNLILENLTTPPDENLGDFSLPCFVFAKTLKQSPVNIANMLKEKIVLGGYLQRVEVLGGYLNFFLNKEFVSKKIIESKDIFNKNASNGKTACFDYCSVNLAKYMHIGHWATTILGESMARIYEFLGYNVVRINYVGDFGTAFAKMIAGFIDYGTMEDVDAKGIDALQDYYVKFNANETEQSLEKAREISSLIEKCDDYYYPIYQKFVEISLKETKRLVSKIGIEFDDWNGESFYTGMMQPMLDKIIAGGITQISEKALIVDLNDYNLGVSVLQRGDGASLYVTRDLAAAAYRYEKYHYDEMIYVTAVQQCNHFDKMFKICELMNFDYAKKLSHMYYGMFSLPEGKISSRRGKQALFEDLLNLACDNVEKVIENREFDEDRQSVVNKIAKSAVAFSVLKVDRIKDKVFDAESATSFDGETAPYIQYTYARCNSILNKAKNFVFNETDIADVVCYEDMWTNIKSIANLSSTINNVFAKKEPSLLAREVISICKNFNKFYANNKVLDENNKMKSMELLKYVELIKNALAMCMNLICVDVLEKM